jgi:hypothetical protein
MKYVYSLANPIKLQYNFWWQAEFKWRTLNTGVQRHESAEQNKWYAPVLLVKGLSLLGDYSKLLKMTFSQECQFFTWKTILT